MEFDIDIIKYKENKNLTDNDLGWLWLDSFSFLNTNKKVKIYKFLKNGNKLFNINDYAKEIEEICGEEDFLRILGGATPEYMHMVLRKVIQYTDFISIENDMYPQCLRDIDVPPIILYYKGDIKLLKSRTIAVVGTRLFDEYGYKVTEKFVKDFVYSGLTIVSGMAEGLDTIAHKKCLELQGKTIAVLSGGINKIYPAINTELCKQIMKEGLVITEWPPQTDSLRYMFPIRNRIIAGISEAVLVTQAGMKSGVRYTVEYALDYNKTVYAVPGNITSYRSSYANTLIKSCQSMLVTDPEEIIKDLNVTYVPVYEREDFTKEEAKIFAILEDNEQAHFDYIVEKTGIESKKLLGMLTGLEIRKKIKRIPGNYFIKLD